MNENIANQACCCQSDEYDKYCVINFHKGNITVSTPGGADVELPQWDCESGMWIRSEEDLKNAIVRGLKVLAAIGKSRRV